MRNDRRTLFEMLPQALALVALVLLGACGYPTETPLEPASTIQPDRTAATNQFVFGLPSARLSKTAPSAMEFLETSGLFPLQTGGNLNVAFDRSNDDPADNPVRVVTTSFTVSGSSIGGAPVQGLAADGAVVITMGVHSGLDLEDVAVDFSPSGLTFNPNAVLNVVVTGSLTPGSMTVYHVYHDGTVERVRATITAHGDNWLIRVPVPGFSQYSWDDD